MLFLTLHLTSHNLYLNDTACSHSSDKERTSDRRFALLIHRIHHYTNRM